MKAIVLAGQRPSSRGRRGADAPTPLTPVAGVPALVRVVEALRSCASIDGGLLVGPALASGGHAKPVREALAAGDFTWMAPAAEPTISALRAIKQLNAWPIILTTADHALLTADILDRFCAAAAKGSDLVVGMTPHHLVQARFPQTKRTRLRFADGACCSTNLFYLANAEAAKAIAFWGQMQDLRKSPWRIAQRLGWHTLAAYLSGALSVKQALAAISKVAGCAIDWVGVDDPRAAIDVDTWDDHALAERLLQCQQQSS